LWIFGKGPLGEVSRVFAIGREAVTPGDGGELLEEVRDRIRASERTIDVGRDLTILGTIGGANRSSAGDQTVDIGSRIAFLHRATHVEAPIGFDDDVRDREASERGSPAVMDRDGLGEANEEGQAHPFRMLTVLSRKLD
jgi:hypothetical protein